MSTLFSVCASCDRKVWGFASTHLPEIGDRYSLSFGDAEISHGEAVSEGYRPEGYVSEGYVSEGYVSVGNNDFYFWSTKLFNSMRELLPSPVRRTAIKCNAALSIISSSLPLPCCGPQNQGIVRAECPWSAVVMAYLEECLPP
jgi:hypothetical protein